MGSTMMMKRRKWKVEVDKDGYWKFKSGDDWMTQKPCVTAKLCFPFPKLRACSQGYCQGNQLPLKY
jgi:hypothetical protein